MKHISCSIILAGIDTETQARRDSAACIDYIVDDL